MHPAELYDSVHPVAPCGLGQRLLPVGSLDTQPQSLYGSIELRDHFQEIIHEKDAERAALHRLGYFRAPSQEDGPIRRLGKDCAVPRIIKKPSGTGETDGRGYNCMDFPARMDAVLLLKSKLQILDELTGIASAAVLEKQCLW